MTSSTVGAKRFPRLAAWAILAAYAASVVVRAWHNPSGAHGQRQMDTGGMALALALDLKREGASALWHSLAFPRVLDRGLSSGINAAEFPLLPLLSWPFFLLGPHLGSFLSSLLIAAANALAACIALPRLLRAWGAEAPLWLCALLYVSIGSIAFQVPILMPEGLSFPLLVAGSALLCARDAPGSRRVFAGALALALSVAVKPTAVVGLVMPALYPWLAFGGEPARAGARRALPIWAALAGALAFPAWWYGIHAHEILAHADGQQVFALARLDPAARLREVGPAGALQLILRQLQEWQFPFACGLGWAAWAAYREPALLAALLAALLGAISLDGAHIWPHFYYFYGAGLVPLVLIPRLLASAPRAGGWRWLRRLALVTLFWGAIYSIRGNVWVTARTPDWWSLAAAARPLVPGDAHLVTDDEVDPTELFYIGRIGTKAGSKAPWICEQRAYRGLRLVFLTTPETLQRARAASAPCLGEPVFRETEAGRWAVWVREPSRD